jgi:hypothetical protein
MVNVGENPLYLQQTKSAWHAFVLLPHELWVSLIVSLVINAMYNNATQLLQLMQLLLQNMTP